MGSISYFRATRPDTGHIRKLIENGLLFDWSITIEYVNNNTESAFWQQWNQSFFALQSAEPVIAALMDCYNKNPDHLIRLNAEKFRPQTRMVHMVYNPVLQSVASEQATRKTVAPYRHIEDSTASNAGISI